jgi:hypothetical protein
MNRLRFAATANTDAFMLRAFPRHALSRGGRAEYPPGFGSSHDPSAVADALEAVWSRGDKTAASEALWKLENESRGRGCSDSSQQAQGTQIVRFVVLAAKSVSKLAVERKICYRKFKTALDFMVNRSGCWEHLSEGRYWA